LNIFLLMLSCCKSPDFTSFSNRAQQFSTPTNCRLYQLQGRVLQRLIATLLLRNCIYRKITRCFRRHLINFCRNFSAKCFKYRPSRSFQNVSEVDNFDIQFCWIEFERVSLVALHQPAVSNVGWCLSTLNKTRVVCLPYSVTPSQNCKTVRTTKWNWNETVSKLFQNCFVSVSFRRAHSLRHHTLNI